MTDIDTLLQENRKFPPPGDFVRSALVSTDDLYAKAAADPEQFWAEQADELEWIRKWDTVMKWEPPHCQWFLGGKLNVSVNCVDRHANSARKTAPAIIWEGEPGDQRTLTYATLSAEVNRFAGVSPNGIATQNASDVQRDRKVVNIR